MKTVERVQKPGKIAVKAPAVPPRRLMKVVNVFVRLAVIIFGLILVHIVLIRLQGVSKPHPSVYFISTGILLPN